MFLPPMQPRRDPKDQTEFTLRDRFASEAMSSLLSSPPAGPAQTFDEFAEDSYKMADAMLRERARTYENGRDSQTACRLTETERASVRKAAEAFEENDDDEDCDNIAKSLRGLLRRSL